MSCQLRAGCVSQYGGVAQLGERTVRIRKVKGSNPSVSTMSSQALYRLRRLFMLCFKSRLALTPLLLLSKSNPLRWTPIWFFLAWASFQRNPPLRVGGIIFDDEIHCVDEICLDGRIVDFFFCKSPMLYAGRNKSFS